ncbi:ATP-binding protein [Verrucomicrobium spinosum]|uniref:ATP-binding protein n=1 Tax=Verrucomicrobium spinosum TaxID=2736 RepID=UPI000174591D|nr:ATP-binding protein [Verrucomicrobium spinosum]
MRPGSLSTKLNVHLRETELVGKIVREFGQWHDVPEQTVFLVKLSLDELVTNIVVHSAGQIPCVREIVLRLTTNQHELWAEVEDDGCAFNPLDLPIPDVAAPLQERSPGGLGIHLVRSLMDRVNYKRVGQRNLLVLSKKVTQPSAVELP